MPHTTEYTDAAGNRPASTETLAIHTAQPKQVGLLLKSLGLSVSRQVNASGQSFLVVQCPGLTLTLTPADQPSDPNWFTLHFAVASLASTLAAAEAQFGQVAMQPFDTQWGRRAIVTDVEGRRLVITEVRPVSAAAVELTGGKMLPGGFGIPSPLNPGAVAAPQGMSSSLPPIEPEELKALGAAKRGAAVTLIGLAFQIFTIIAIATTVLTTESRGGRAVNQQALGQQFTTYGMIFAIGVLASIAGKVMCAIPNTSKASYTPLWTAVGLQVVVTAMSVVIPLMRNSDLSAPLGIIVVLMDIVVPLLFVQFLGSIMEQVRNRSVSSLSKTTNNVYGIWLVTIAVGFGLMWFVPNRSMGMMLFFAMGLVTLVCIGFIVAFLVQVLTAKPNGSWAR